METTMNTAHISANIYAEVKRRFSAVDDLAHGWEHVDRTYKLALHIAELEGANQFIVGMAALMHDLGRVPAHAHTQGSQASHMADGEAVTEQAHHADLSVVYATELLNAYDVPSEVQQRILHAIISHSYSRNIEARTLEARVVRDADRLEGIGATGILRWAITGVMRHAPHIYHPTDPFAKQHALDDSMYMLDHFYTKLLKLEDTMATETGRRLARRRTAFLHTFLDELKSELDLLSIGG